jgi:hypothetical protein
MALLATGAISATTTPNAINPRAPDRQRRTHDARSAPRLPTSGLTMQFAPVSLPGEPDSTLDRRIPAPAQSLTVDLRAICSSGRRVRKLRKARADTTPV